MSVSIEQLDAFHRFANSRLEAGETDLTLEELLQMWRVETERAEAIEDVKLGVADIKAGHCHTIEEVDREIRVRLDELRRNAPQEPT